MSSHTQVSLGPQPHWVCKEDINHTMSSSLIFSVTLGAQLAALGTVCCTADRIINLPQTCFWCRYPRDWCSAQSAQTNDVGPRMLGAEEDSQGQGHR